MKRHKAVIKIMIWLMERKYKFLLKMHLFHGKTNGNIDNNNIEFIVAMPQLHTSIDNFIHIFTFQLFSVKSFRVVLFFSADKTPAGFPIITQSPQTRVVEIGHTAVMQCRSTGNPTPKIFWLKDSVGLDMTNIRYSLLDGKSFSGTLLCAYFFSRFHDLSNYLPGLQ